MWFIKGSKPEDPSLQEKIYKENQIKGRELLKDIYEYLDGRLDDTEDALISIQLRSGRAKTGIIESFDNDFSFIDIKNVVETNQVIETVDSLGRSMADQAKERYRSLLDQYKSNIKLLDRVHAKDIYLAHY